jgi:hypothetical protein
MSEKFKIIIDRMAVFFRDLKLALILIIIVFVCLILSGGYFGIRYYQDSKNAQANLSTAQNKDVYVEFASEVWDIIKQNHWEKQADDQLANLYKLGAEKVLGKPVEMTPRNKDEVRSMIDIITTDMDVDKKKEFVITLSDIVLANLKPFGRSRLFGQKQQEELKNTVENRDPSTDLYATIGADKDAPIAEIEKKYEEKVEAIDESTPEGKVEIAKLDRAKVTLSADDTRSAYDKYGVESTVITKIYSPDIYYMHITKISPQTFEEFQQRANEVDKKPLKALIIDLRGNIGGAIDILPYFLGPFIGPNSYGYEFFHQGEYTPYKTTTGWLPSLIKFKKVVILIDGESQSSAEVMAATFKKYNVGAVVGTHTKGWGTIEQLMPLKTIIDSKESYSALMVHSLTVRDDGQPIEGRGVDPIVNIDDKDWTRQLLDYVNYPTLVDVVKKIINEKKK